MSARPRRRSQLPATAPAIGVRISAIQREFDSYVQSQLRTENAGASYATTRANSLNQLQTVYGDPGSDASLETVYNNFTSALQALSSSPDDVGCAQPGRQYRRNC